MNTPLSPKKRMRDAFLQTVLDGMDAQEDIFFLTADFGSPVLDVLQQRHPQRFLNVGIAEQNAINVAAGLALEGFRVIVYAIAPFLTMRCLEQVRTNLALLSQVRAMNVTLAGVGAGFSYEVSGPTHQALEDLSLMRSIPGVGVWSPADAATASGMAEAALAQTGIRYVRLDSHPLPDLAPWNSADAARGFRVLESQGDAALLATGYMTHVALAVRDELARRGVAVRVVDGWNLTDFDGAALASALSGCRVALTMEEGFLGAGGLDSLAQMELSPRVPSVAFLHAGLPRRYRFEIGKRAALLAAHGLSAEMLADRVETALKANA